MVTPQRFDSVFEYQVTITFTDGTTAVVNIEIAQDTAGNLYLVPPVSSGGSSPLANTPIQSITINSVVNATSPGLVANRADVNIVTCFCAGTLVQTDCGAVPIEDVRLVDLVETVDHGYQPIRWIGSRTIYNQPEHAPIQIMAGALDNPTDVWVSPQHRVLLTGWRAELYVGEDEVLIPAIQLVNDRTIRQRALDEVTYYHLMFDAHEIIWAGGIASESFHPGQKSLDGLADASRNELLALFPQLGEPGAAAYGPSVRPTTKSFEAALFA